MAAAAASSFLSRLRSAAGAVAGGAVRSYGRVARGSLFAQLCPLGNPSISLTPELDRWVAGGKTASIAELQRIIRVLRKRRRFKQALEISEWMGEKGSCKFSSADYAIQLDLIGRVRGLKSAEEYFNSMKEDQKVDKAYGSLLNCYVRELKMDESLSHMQKMKELGLASSALPYNNIMCLYANSKQYEEVPQVLEEMKQNHVVPDNFSYRICINSYGVRSDIEGMERTLKEMESQSHLIMDWNTYSVVANIYMKANLPAKAISALKKTEENLAGTRNVEGYTHLISLYGCLGNKHEVMRIWELLKKVCSKVTNKDYITMLGSLAKLDEFMAAESLLKEWQSSAENFDFRVPNVLLIKYCQKGLTEKAEALIQEMMKDGKVPIPNSFAILAAAFEVKGEIKKSVEFMMSAFSCFPGNHGWKPQPQLVNSLLSWLADEGELTEVEAFVGMLRSIIPMNKEMYITLIKANRRSGKEVNEILKSMETDGIELDEQVEKILQ